MKAGPWKSVADFETWWRANVVAFNRLSVTDTVAWEAIAAAVEGFQEQRKRWEALDE